MKPVTSIPSTATVYDMTDSASRTAGLRAAVEALREGKLVGMPTETVYGLAADAANPDAVAAIYTAKGRPALNPLIAHVEDMRMADRLATLTPLAREAAAAFWPGPLTMVLEKRADAPISGAATAGLNTLALRMPAQPVARELLAAFGGALVAPSANLSGRVTATTAGHVADDLGNRIAVILDDGPSPGGLESTIVSFVEEPRLLRPGALPKEALEQTLGLKLAGNDSHDAEKPQAPGMLASHYAPSARLRLNATEVRPGEALLAFGPKPGALPAGTRVISLSEAGDLVEAASRLFSALRELDRDTDAIAVAPIPETGLGVAINDRLRRAAAPRP